MAENTAIEWADHTHNFWTGCQACSPGCAGCYAESWAKRAGRDFAVRMLTTSTTGNPAKWNKAHVAFVAQHGRRQRVFANSLSDWLDNQVPIEWLVKALDTVRLTPNLDWLLLSKRIGNWRRRIEEARAYAHDHGEPDLAAWLSDWLDGKAPEHVAIGATVVDQSEADRDIPKLLAVPARVRFLSMEPLLGLVDLKLQRPARSGDRQDLDGWCSNITTAAGAGIHWVICGGESGSQARPMHPDWVRSVRNQCWAAGVPYLFKQWGEWAEEDTGMPEPLIARERDPEFAMQLDRHDGFISLDGHFVTDPDDMVDGVAYRGLMRLGKKATGRLLDGVEHNGFPPGAINV